MMHLGNVGFTEESGKAIVHGEDHVNNMAEVFALYILFIYHPNMAS